MSVQRITQNMIDDVKASYPEDVQEAVQYLFGYCNSQCSGSRDRLAARLNQHGFTQTQNYFYKLFTGKWMEEGEFKASVKNINSMAQKLRDAELGRLSEGKFPPVQTEIMDLMRDAIDAVRAPDRICKWLFISGLTGGQKTYCSKWYSHEVNSGRTGYVEAPHEPNPGHLIYLLANLVGKCYVRTRYERYDHITQNINENFNLIIDNAQRLYNPRAGNRQDCFSLLQRIQDDTGCSVVLIFVKEVIFLGSDKSKRKFVDPLDEILHGPAAAFFNQFLGRIGGEENILQLPDRTSASDLRAFAKAAGFKAKHVSLILPILKFLDSRPGGLRVVMHNLQQARNRALKGMRDLHVSDLLDHLPTATLGADQLDKLEALKLKALEG